jgi:hypothetical protein
MVQALLLVICGDDDEASDAIPIEVVEPQVGSGMRQGEVEVKSPIARR